MQPGWSDSVEEVQVIFDPVGGELTDASLKRLARGGRLLIVGFSSGQVPALRANRLLLKNASALGVYWSHKEDSALLARAFADLWRRHARGELRFAASQQYPFLRLPHALESLAGRKTTGKCVLTMQ
jgi:NADPH2:quinone reductase